MKRYTMSFADSIEHKPANPERTARKTSGWDITFQEWPNRKAMARSIRMQEKAPPRSDHWRAVQRLSDTEGY
jgi:hypothetical protein